MLAKLAETLFVDALRRYVVNMPKVAPAIGGASTRGKFEKRGGDFFEGRL